MIDCICVAFVQSSTVSAGLGKCAGKRQAARTGQDVSRLNNIVMFCICKAFVHQNHSAQQSIACTQGSRISNGALICLPLVS